MNADNQANDIREQELRLLLNSIPDFSPGDNLSVFINEVDNLGRHLANRITEDQVYVVNFTIRSKIKKEARDFIANQNALTWVDIKAALVQRYGDQRSEELLLSTLQSTVQSRNETYLDYYSRILKAFNALIQNTQLNSTNAALTAFKKTNYTDLALKTFQNGLLEPYRTYVSHFELNKIEDVLNKCRSHDNQKQEWEYSEFLRKAQATPNTKTETNPVQPKPFQPMKLPYPNSQNPYKSSANFMRFMQPFQQTARMPYQTGQNYYKPQQNHYGFQRPQYQPRPQLQSPYRPYTQTQTQNQNQPTPKQNPTPMSGVSAHPNSALKRYFPQNTHQVTYLEESNPYDVFPTEENAYGYFEPFPTYDDQNEMLAIEESNQDPGHQDFRQDASEKPST